MLFRSVDEKKKRYDIIDIVRSIPVFRSKKLIFMIFTLFCFLAMGTCVIVNYAINQRITWAAYPLLSIPFGWILTSTLFLRKYVMATLCALTVFAIPFLYFIEKITPVSDWFLPLGLPCAIAGIIFIWIIYLLFRFTNISIWYKLAVSAFLAMIIVSPVIEHSVNIFLGTEPKFLDCFIDYFSGIAVTASFIIIGLTKAKSKVTDAKITP